MKKYDIIIKKSNFAPKKSEKSKDTVNNIFLLLTKFEYFLAYLIVLLIKKLIIVIIY